MSISKVEDVDGKTFEPNQWKYHIKELCDQEDDESKTKNESQLSVTQKS